MIAEDAIIYFLAATYFALGLAHFELNGIKPASTLLRTLVCLLIWPIIIYKVNKDDK